MAVDIDVVIDRSTVSKGAGGAITGVVALRLGDVWFPDNRWNDFIVVVLGWWARQAAALRAGDPARLDFMDGPYSVVARPVDGVSQMAVSGRDRPAVEQEDAADEAGASHGASLLILVLADFS